VEDRKNFEYKKNKRSCEVLGVVEEFIAKYDTWEKKEDLENIKEVAAEFEGRLNAEVRRQEKLDIVEERDFRRGELLEKYTAKMLYIGRMIKSLKRSI